MYLDTYNTQKWHNVHIFHTTFTRDNSDIVSGYEMITRTENKGNGWKKKYQRKKIFSFSTRQHSWIIRLFVQVDTRWGGAMMMINLRNFPSLVCSNFSCNNKQAILSTDFALTFEILYSSFEAISKQLKACNLIPSRKLWCSSFEWEKYASVSELNEK